MRKQVLVSVDHGETRVALLEATGKPAAKGSRRRRKPQNPAAGYHVAELYNERRGARSIVGNIYKGRVDNVLPGLEAAFVDIGLDKNGFLHVDEIVLPGVEVPRHVEALIEALLECDAALLECDSKGSRMSRSGHTIGAEVQSVVFTELVAL